MTGLPYLLRGKNSNAFHEVANKKASRLILGLGAVALGFRYWKSQGTVANP